MATTTTVFRRLRLNRSCCKTKAGLRSQGSEPRPLRKVTHTGPLGELPLPPWPWRYPKKFVRCDLLLHDHFIVKECINLRGNVPITLGACHAVEDRRNEVTPGLPPARRQSIDPLQHRLRQRDRDFLHCHNSFLLRLKPWYSLCSYHTGFSLWKPTMSAHCRNNTALMAWETFELAILHSEGNAII
jgi:hypothetical protein